MLFIFIAQRFGFLLQPELKAGPGQRTSPALCLCILLAAAGCTDRIAIDNSVNDSAPVTDTQGDTSSNDLDTSALLETDSDTDTHSNPVDDTDIGTYLHTYVLLYTWVADESEYNGVADTALTTCSGETIATVSSDFALAARNQGTARLLDGRMINIGGCDCSDDFSCFTLIEEAFPWGMGSQNNPLVPFVSLTADVIQIPFGTVVYSQQLDGVSLPDNTIHDGCLRVDDTPTDPLGQVIHLFAGQKEYREMLDPQIPEQVSLYQNASRCDYL